MDTKTPFTTFKAVIQTDGASGQVSYFAHSPLILLEHAISLALLSESQMDVRAIYERTTSQLHEAEAWLRENGFQE